MIYELLKKQVQQNTAFLNVYGRAKKQKKNEVTINSFGTKLTKIIEFPLYDGTPLVPNANKKDLVFFERVGNVRDISDSYYSVLEEDFKVIVWLNKDTFDVAGKTYNGDIDIIVQELNRALISNKNSYILSIEFENATDENVFSPYTFSEAENAMTIEPFSAFELNYKIKYLASCNNLDSNIIVLNSECEPVGNQSNGKIYVGDTEVTIKNTTGETLYFESIPATQDREFEIQNSIYRVYNPQGKLLAEGEIPAEGVEEITVSLGFDDLPRIVNTEDKDVGHENDVTWIVEDSTVIIKNTEDTELYSVDVPAEDSREQIINDSQAIIKDSSGSTLKSENILAEGSKDITITDSTSTIKDSSGTILYNESIPAEGSKDTTIQDSQVTLKNTKDEILSSENILAEGSKEITAPDSNFKITDFSGNKTFIEGGIASGSSEEFKIWAKDYRTLILKYDTTLNGNNEIRLSATGYDMKYIAVKDEQGEILEEFNTSDNTILITNYPIGKYYIEIRQREGDYFRFNGNNAQIQETLVELVQFGDVIWNSGNLNYIFNACTELVIKADDEMKIREGAITIVQPFNKVKSIEKSKWIENFPFSQVEGDMNNFFYNTPNFDFDTLTLDFKGAEGIEHMGNFFIAYQLGGSNGIQTFIIKNMESSLNITGTILSSFAWTNGLKKVIFQGLKVSQNMSVWRPTDPINVMLFFLNLGDLTGETQATITLRTQEWDLLSLTQKDVIDEVLINKNWALSLI